MTIELKPEDQRVIEQAIHLGEYNDSGEVISAALEMFVEGLGDVAVSKARDGSRAPRWQKWKLSSASLANCN